jgi:L-fuculose-phosphate aldolase
MRKRPESGSALDESKKVLIDIGYKCWLKGWVAANDGNLSWRLSDTEILCTPTGVSKGMLTKDHFCVVDLDGNVRGRGPYRPSSEIKVHLRVMRERPDVKSVFHAHPPYATAHAIAGIPLTECVLPEIIIGLGSIPLAPYGTPSTDELPDRLAPLIKNHDAWLLENHGVLTAGRDPYQAYFRMEAVELYAKMLHLARGLGKVNVLSDSNVRTLLRLRKKFGIEDKDNITVSRSQITGRLPNIKKSRVPAKAPYVPAAGKNGESFDDEFVAAIVKKVLAALR